MLAAEAGPDAVGEVMNVGCGDRISLLDLVGALNELLGTNFEPEFEPQQRGDVRHSLASIEKAKRLLGYEPLVPVREGLRQTVTWLEERRDIVVRANGHDSMSTPVIHEVVRD